MPDRLVLWDVDGTLIDSGGVGAEMFDVALERALGHRPPSRVPMSGKTDPQIVSDYFDLLDLAHPEREVHLPEVLEHLAMALAEEEESIRLRGRVLSGVVEALKALSGYDDVVQSLLTGNLAPNALVKVRAFGLDRWLDLEVGAFGSDHADRRRLVPFALDRLASLRGRRIEPSEVWIVGDTPHDLACARAGGVRCLLVASGRFTVEDLAAGEPDAVWPDLSDTCALVELLRS